MDSRTLPPQHGGGLYGPSEARGQVSLAICCIALSDKNQAREDVMVSCIELCVCVAHADCSVDIHMNPNTTYLLIFMWFQMDTSLASFPRLG